MGVQGAKPRIRGMMKRLAVRVGGVPRKSFFLFSPPQAANYERMSLCLINALI